MYLSAKNNNEIPVTDDTYVVCIGASAGGLEAINELFDNIADGKHIAFIVVQHLSSDYKSLLVELLGKHTHLPVEEAQHHQKVEPGKVYVIPNNKELTIKDGQLILSGKEFEKGPNTAIDTFLQSLAYDQRHFAIAVLLSGTGTDGTRGIETIKSQDGFVIVQDPESAKFDGMPRNAIASGYADLVLSPADIPDQIGNYIDGILPQRTPPFHKHQEAIQNILSHVYKRTGYDFSQYKQPTVLRRIARRMQLVKLEEVEAYERFVRTQEEEPPLLAKEFFIGVTNFFRDKDAFVCLYEEAILRIVESKEDHDSVKVWVTACSTGQEAYTIAFLIDKALQQLNKTLEIKIFASDIDKTSVEFAARGRYQHNQLLGTERKVVEEYFIESEEGLTVIPRIRKQIVFAAHDILKDPPFIKNDLVSCRNLLIYLNLPLQENVLATLNFSLNPGGYLFLGTSENPSLLRRGFSEVDSKWKIYKRNGEGNPVSRRIINTGKMRSATLPAYTAARTKTDVHLWDDFRKALVDKLGYAGIYVNENYEIKEGIGNFRKYLTLPDKLSSLNVLKMAPTELSALLSTALRKSQKENSEQSIRNIKVRFDDVQRLIDIFIYPPRLTSGGMYTLLVFADAIIDEAKSPAYVHDVSLLQKDHYVRQLEDELRETRTNLQMAVEGLETANEELQSSNEELQSANEELQSSNEELQSLNEELHTLNTEHQLRIKELVELNDDISNYLQTSMIGQIFLDHRGRIRRFNNAASAVINIIENDIGRPIEHITHHIRTSTFFEDISKANKTGQVIEREIELHNGSIYLIRIMPYLRQQKERDGLVITMVDVSATKNLNSLIKSVFDASSNPIFVFESVRDRDGLITDFQCKVANFNAGHLFGKSNGQEQLLLKEHFPQLSSPTLFKRYVEAVNNGKQASLEFNFTINNNKYWYQAGISKMQDGFVLVLSDITQRRDAEDKLRRNYNELLVTKETLRELNSQLESKVKQRTYDLETSEERFRLIASLTNDVIWDWHFAGNSLWWSDSYYELFGFPPTDESIRTHSFRLQHIHPDDRPQVEEALHAALQGSADEFKVSYRYRKQNGDYAYVLDRGTLLKDDQGVPYRMIGAMMDVTKLEQSQQQLQQKNTELETILRQFRFVTDFIPQIVWSSQPDGNIDFFNQQWSAYTGYSNDVSKGNQWMPVLHPDDWDRSWRQWQHCLKTGELYETEYRMRRHDGVYRWFLARASAMRDEEGNIYKWFGTCTDIDDQKTAERLLEGKVAERTSELKHLNTRLEESNADLLQFASVASHDLKEPLRKIHFFSGLIKEQYPAETSGKLSMYIERITKASSRANNLVNDVLSYSRLGSDNLFEKVDCNRVVHDLLLDLELVIEEKKAVIDCDKLPLIEAVPGQMRQLFQNLISNGIKFHKQGEAPKISIKCKEVEKSNYPALKENPGKLFEISIKDEGVGFDQQYAVKIFSLFQRLNSKEQFEGTGIGLAIAKRIVDRHHGLVFANSKPGAGAEFVIVLPEMQPEKTQESTEP